MTCSAASTLTPIASIPVVPSLPGVPSGVQQSLNRILQLALAQIQAAGGATGVNVIPQQYALIAGASLPPIASSSNCTVSLDTSNKVSAAAGGSYKIAITGSPAQVTFSSDAAWPFHGNWQWLVSFFQQATAEIAGELTITTSGGKTYPTDFATTLSSGGFVRLYDALNLGADASAAFGLSVTFTGGTGQTVWLDGIMMEPYYGVPMQPSPFISTSGALLLDNNPDGAFSKILTSRTAGNVAYNFRGVWSSTASYLVGDEVVYGSSYWLAVGSSTGSAPATGSANWQVIGTYSGFEGAWSSSATYSPGAEVTYSGNFWVCVTANTNSAPTTSNPNWQIAGPTSLDNITDGTSRFAVTNGADLNGVSSVDPNNRAGIDFSQSVHINKNLGNVADGSSRFAVTNAANLLGVSSVDSNNRALIDFSQPGHLNKTVDYVPDGTTRFAVVNGPDLKGVSLIDASNRALIDFSQPGHLNKTADYIPRGTSYAIPTLNTGGGENLIQNPVFSNGTAGWVLGTLATGVTLPNGATGDVIEGTSANYSFPVQSNSFDLVPGATYLYSVWVNVSVSGLACVLLWGNYSDGGVASFTSTGAWQFISGTYTVPTTGTNATELLGTLVPIVTAATSATVQVWGAVVVKVRNLDNEVYDGTTYQRMPIANMDGNRRGLIDFSQSGHLYKNLGNVADGSSRFAVTNAANLLGVSSVDPNNRALIDFSQSGHLNKTADYIAPGTSYAIPTLNTGGGENLVQNPVFSNGIAGWQAGTLVTGVTLPNGATGDVIEGTSASYSHAVQSNVFDLVPGATYLYSAWVNVSVSGLACVLYCGDYSDGGIDSFTSTGAWQFISGTRNVPTTGTEAAELLGSLILVVAAATSATVQVWGASVVKVRNLDNEVYDGTTYQRMPIANMDANRRGLIDFSQSGHLYKNLEYMGDGTARFAVTNAANLFGVSSVDPNNRAGIDFSQSVHLNKNLDNIGDGSTYLRMPTPPAASAAALTSLSQSGTTTAINVGAGTYYLGGLTVNLNSGSVDPGTYDTWYVYADSPNWAGGAVTYEVTTAGQVMSQAPFRFYLGQITTSSGGGGSGGGGFYCFSGDTRVLTAEGFRRFDELPERCTIVNHTGTHSATLLVHPDSTEEMRRMGPHLVTSEHRIQVGMEWRRARELFHEIAPSQPRTVYNLHVESSNPDDMHYLLENGLTAHNVKP
jgi:hypothetical protein